MRVETNTNEISFVYFQSGWRKERFGWHSDGPSYG